MDKCTLYIFDTELSNYTNMSDDYEKDPDLSWDEPGLIFTLGLKTYELKKMPAYESLLSRKELLDVIEPLINAEAEWYNSQDGLICGWDKLIMTKFNNLKEILVDSSKRYAYKKGFYADYPPPRKIYS